MESEGKTDETKLDREEPVGARERAEIGARGLVGSDMMINDNNYNTEEYF